MQAAANILELGTQGALVSLCFETAPFATAGDRRRRICDLRRRRA
ncbi:hypothetical protein [uncultured Adlercreutzia sp.]|nr:hypothetical protein [uncultured Adlercreutzia sp.]